MTGDNPIWRQKKKQMIISLKQHSDGLRYLEQVTLKYGTQLMDQMIEHGQGKAFDPFCPLYKVMGSIMMTLVYGSHSEKDIELVYHHYTETTKVFQANGPYLLLDILPPLRFVLPMAKKAYQVFTSSTKEMLQTYRSFAEARKKQILSEQNTFEFNDTASKPCIDHFINLSNNDHDDGLSKSTGTTRLIEPGDLPLIGSELLLAGISTTAASIYSLLAILVNHPCIQEKCFRQIADTIGNRPPTMSDYQNLPYIEALILELFRYTSNSPLFVPHCATRDTELKGHVIPKGTLVMCNIWHLHHDEKNWSQPWVFRPDRFIENGRVIPTNHKIRQNLIIFSGGRRRCPGSIFAKNRIFLLITMLLQKFEFLPAKGEPLPLHDPRCYDTKLVLETKPYKLQVKLRN